MEYLVLKIGNFHLVALLFKDDVIIDKIKLPYKALWYLNLKNTIDRHLPIISAFVSSVNSKVENELAIALSSINKHFKIPLSNLNICLNVDDHNVIDSDTFTNCCLALKLYPKAVDKDYNFLIVSILTGIEMSAKCLNIMTDMLPIVDLDKPAQTIDKNTAHCIQSEFYFGFIGSVTYLLVLIVNENFEKKASIVITGGLKAPENGQSGFTPKTPIAKSLQKDILNQIPDLKIAHDLTLIGMYEILKEQLH